MRKPARPLARTTFVEPATPRIPAVPLPEEALDGLPLVPELEHQGQLWTGCARGNASKSRWSEGAFRGARLGSVSWNGAHWQDLQWDECDFANADARECYGARVRFCQCRLVGFCAAESTWFDTVWSATSAALSQWRYSHFNRVRFEHCDLTGADFQNSDLRHAQFVECNLTEAEFSFCQLQGADWRSCDLTGLRVDAPSLAGVRVTPLQAAQFATLLGLDVVWPNSETSPAPGKLRQSS